MTLTNPIKNDLTQQQTRKQLLMRLKDEKPNIIAAIEKFSVLHGRHTADVLQALEMMIAAFDRVIAAGDWESSLFLRNTVKPLKNMREEAARLREVLLGNITQQAVAAPVLSPDKVRIYIAIFQYKAHMVQDWEAQLRQLPQYILGRPIYQHEAAVRQAIRAKLVQTSDAYVCVGVPKTAIQTGEFHPSQTDKQGNALLQLAHGTVQSEDILEFVYQDQRYYFINGKLIEQTQR